MIHTGLQSEVSIQFHCHQLNLVVFTKLLIIADVLSKYDNVVLLSVLVAFCPFVSKRITASVVTSSSPISNQLEAGFFIVRHIKSISVPPLPVRVYGPIKSTNNACQGFVMKSLVGSFPYLCLCCLLTSHVQQFLTCYWMVCLIAFQYIALCSISSRQVCPGYCMKW